MIWSAVVGLARDAVTGYSEGRKQKREIKAAQAERKIAMIRDDKCAASDLDLYFVQNNGWMADVSFYIMFSPLVMAFIGFDEEVKEGFEALKVVPEGYMYAVGLMLVAIWGFRRLLQGLIQSKIGKLVGGKGS